MPLIKSLVPAAYYTSQEAIIASSMSNTDKQAAFMATLAQYTPTWNTATYMAIRNKYALTHPI